MPGVSGGGGGTARVFIDIPAGHVLDNRYRIRRKLGQGGYGEVYEVEDDFASAKTALKVIPYHDDSSKRNLLLEFKSREKIRDFDHVIKGLDPRPVTYLSQNLIVYPMELAEKSFRDWLNETRDDLEDRLEDGIALFRQACQGVAAIHAAGLIHLDIKPENILLIRKADSRKGKEEWTAKVSDLGLARGLGMEGLARYEDGVGTPAYMAPEQILAARAKDVGPEADIYALGMILYELLDGELPYSGTPKRILEKKRDPNIEITELRTGHPAGEVAMACLERDKKKRPISVEMLLEGLEKGLARAQTERRNRDQAQELLYEAKGLIDEEYWELAQKILLKAKNLDNENKDIASLLKQVEKELNTKRKDIEVAERKRKEGERKKQEEEEKKRDAARKKADQAKRRRENLKEVRAYLIIERSGRTVVLTKAQTVLGRSDLSTGFVPDIDLTDEDEEKYLSRKHAIIQNEDGKYYLTEGKGAINGTFLNDNKLETGIKYQLHGNDDITLCHLNIKFLI